MDFVLLQRMTNQFSDERNISFSTCEGQARVSYNAMLLLKRIALRCLRR